MVSPGPSHVSALQTRSSGQVAQPAEMREGLVNAYTVLTEVLFKFKTIYFLMVKLIDGYIAFLLAFFACLRSFFFL